MRLDRRAEEVRCETEVSVELVAVKEVGKLKWEDMTAAQDSSRDWASTRRMYHVVNIQLSRNLTPLMMVEVQHHPDLDPCGGLPRVSQKCFQRPHFERWLMVLLLKVDLGESVDL